MLQGFNPKLAKGEIASLSGIQDDPRYFQISAPVQPGNSGGALVDEHGNVVGIVSAKLNEATALVASGALPENVNYAVKSSLLLKFLASVPEVTAKLEPPNTKKENFEDVVKSAEGAAVLLIANQNPNNQVVSGSLPSGDESLSAAEFESEFYARYPYLKRYAIIARWAANQLAANGLRGTKDEVMQAFASATMEEVRQFNSRVEQLQNVANGITPLPQFNEAPPDAGNAYAMANYIERHNAAVDRYEQQKPALKQVQQKIEFVKQQENEKCVQGGQMELGQAGIMALATPEEIAEAAARQKIARQQQQTQVQLANQRALKFDQDQAAKGDEYGLLRMAERYRDGEGVEKDLTKAKEYFSKAITAGSPTAADELKELTNAVQK